MFMWGYSYAYLRLVPYRQQCYTINIEVILMRPTTIEKILQFSTDRDWDQFHNEKDLASSIVLEASELFENFQWKTSDEALKTQSAAINEEAADVLIYTVLLCHKLGIDMDDIILDKLQKNGLKYPVDRAYGSKVKYTHLPGKPPVIGDVAVQPYSDPIAKDHFQHTLATPVPFSDIRRFLSAEQMRALQACYPDGEAYIWGTQPNRTTIYWNRLSVGDVVLFYADKRFDHQAQVTYKLLNSQLAGYLWGTANNKTTWENIYFVTQPVKIDIDVADYNKILGYSETRPVYGFYLHPEARSQLLIKKLGL